jgi:hypothetical protein
MQAHLPFEVDEPLPYTKPRDHFHISDRTKFPVRISQFLEDNEDDVAVEVSICVTDGIRTDAVGRPSARI